MAIRFGYADTTFGQLHYAESGSGRPLLLLHQTPRSWDEFRELIPILADEFRVLALDMVGFGASASLAPPQTIESFADAAWEFLDAVNAGRVAVLGHHTGAAVAMEMAAGRPGEVDAVVLSSCPWTGGSDRNDESGSGGVDRAVREPDGSHLQTLWNLRRPYYPAPATDLLDRFLRDALAHGVDPAEGHRACARYRMADRIEAVTAPVLLLAAGADPFSMRHLPTLRNQLTGARIVLEEFIEDGTVALIEREAPRIAAAVRSFLNSPDVRAVPENSRRVR
ncbi:alpha/beta fold hydrolase [Rhodococcus jostii]|uniref:Pimeloyl-ACP methyl ester carboxylesterase n=1 Tax=Rhodococcus jostii TaxID=132919 RepID=A0A1H5ANX6_RHOJO|nr:alpha/beta hydrolase [Rhodococcus jostii]SED43424.1 Pimeloyl-ACP methyl ester carboxylesterase [Rhodococcus jostii]